MIFLIEYDRSTGRLEKMRAFEDADRRRASDVRLELELSLNGLGVEREVVLLEASSEEALRRTHRRYFENLTELAVGPDEDGAAEISNPR